MPATRDVGAPGRRAVAAPAFERPGPSAEWRRRQKAENLSFLGLALCTVFTNLWFAASVLTFS